MSCCTLDGNTISETLKKNAAFVRGIPKVNKMKELKMFCNMCSGYKIGKEDEYILKLCNERVRIYMRNDNTTDKIRQCLMLCDTVIKTIEFNKRLLQHNNSI